MSRQRRRYFTHPRFQLAFAMAYVRGIFIAILFPACSLFFTVYLLAQDPLITELQHKLLTEEVSRLITLFLIMAGMFCVLFLIIGSYLSFKFVGPVRRIEDWLVQQTSEIETDNLKLRPKDEMVPMSQVLNRLFNK